MKQLPHFKSRKATQALNWLAEKSGGSISKLTALKLIFFTDKYHLRKYGRLVSGDKYFAMKLGPVASGTKSVAELNEKWLDATELEYAETYLSTNDSLVSSIRGVDQNVFSETDLEALDFAWANFSGKNVVEISHDYPEWLAHKKKIESGSKRLVMNLEDFLKPVSSGVEPCYTLSKEEAEARLAQLQEHRKIQDLLS